MTAEKATTPNNEGTPPAASPGGRVLVALEEREGRRIARVTIDNRRKLNTLNRALMAQFVAAIEPLGADDSLRAVVLTGAGDTAFIGGADIDEMAALAPASARGFITEVHRSCAVLRDLPVPVVARLNGWTLGAGLEIAAACDLRIAADTARFGMPEVKLGIPSVVEAALLPLLVGWGRAREMLLLGEVFGAAEAASWGLVERVAPPAELDAAVERVLAALLAAAPGALRLQKRLIRAWEDLPLRQAVDAGIDAFAAAFTSDEPARAMAAFRRARAARRGG
jgi:enoyl-CoA hydratase/carnithine racemase